MEGIVLVLYLAFLALFVVAWVKVLSKAGFSGWWVLVGIIPLVNIVMFLVFAFSEWPALQRTSQPAASPIVYGVPPVPPPPVGGAWT